MKYIKLDDAIQAARPEGLNENRDEEDLALYAKAWNDCIHTYVANLCELPAANVREVVRGHYAKFRTPFTAVCSECGRSLDITWDFCPKCGAVMREPPAEEVDDEIH